MPFSGHALMATCPPPSYITNTGPENPYPHKAPDLPLANLSTLLNLSRQLVTDGQITPIMALQCLKNHELYPSLSRDDVKIIIETLNTKVRCYGFGAVVEDFELIDCLSSVMGTNVDLSVARHRDDSIYSWSLIDLDLDLGLGDLGILGTLLGVCLGTIEKRCDIRNDYETWCLENSVAFGVLFWKCTILFFSLCLCLWFHSILALPPSHPVLGFFGSHGLCFFLTSLYLFNRQFSLLTEKSWSLFHFSCLLSPFPFFSFSSYIYAIVSMVSYVIHLSLVFICSFTYPAEDVYTWNGQWLLRCFLVLSLDWSMSWSTWYSNYLNLVITVLDHHQPWLELILNFSPRIRYIEH